MTRQIQRLLRTLVVAGVVLGIAGAPASAQSVPRKDTPAAQSTRPAPSASSSRGSSEPMASKVDVRIMVVYATTAHSRVDPRLNSLTRYLSHLRYSGYELLQTQSAQLSVNGTQTFTIEGGRKVTVTLLSRDEERVRLRVEINASKGGKLIDTTMSINRDGTSIFAGPKHEDGILVLPLTARY